MAQSLMNNGFDWAVLWQYRAMLAQGLAITLALSVVGLIGATLVGLVAGIAATVGGRVSRAVAVGYVEIARGVPLLVHMYAWYFGLTAVLLPGFLCAVLALASYSGAYMAEVVRAGLQGVPAGQTEAARALGLSGWQAFRRVVIPQALANVAPSMAGLFSQLIKDSSLASVIGVAELTFDAGAIEGETFRTFEAYAGITLLYLVVVTIATRVTIALFGPRALEAQARA
jgi:His/Glu/Gln/Arg/opine family amino acid ABC transporter permease subunit